MVWIDLLYILRVRTCNSRLLITYLPVGSIYR